MATGLESGLLGRYEMTKFWVGQRVVLVRANDLVSRAKNYGKKGVITGFGDYPSGIIMANGQPLSINCDVAISWDGEDFGRAQNTGQLEPILYDGAQPIAESFEEMMGKLREGVVA